MELCKLILTDIFQDIGKTHIRRYSYANFGFAINNDLPGHLILSHNHIKLKLHKDYL